MTRKPITADQLRKLLREQFADVNRVGGISLHQTSVVDAYGSTDAMQAAALLDTDTHWTEVKDEWIEQFINCGGLNFFDALGLRYYLPAYLDWFIRKGDGANHEVSQILMYKLQAAYVGNQTFENLFTPQQMAVITLFLTYVAEHCAEYAQDAAQIMAAYQRSKPRVA